MDVTGAVIEILKSTVPPLYYRKLQENMKTLKRTLELLNSRKEDIERRLSAECHSGKLPKAAVNNWIGNTRRINEEAQAIEQKIKEVKYFPRARLGKLVDVKIQEVKEHYQNGAFESLVIDGTPASGFVLPTAKKNMDKIWQYLMGNEVMKIGVCGMGGAGKTTIITHINNKLLKETTKFKNVIWVTVSQPLDLKKLQNQIAAALNEDLPNDEDEIIRVFNVFKMLEKRKFVLILDDISEVFPLEKVGIPEPTVDNECKLVITTRSLEVCRAMGCKVVNVKPLPDDEALKLFSDKVGENILRAPTLEKTIKLVVEQCAGLPLAIVTIASCMKGVDDIREWRNALNELSNPEAKDSEVIARLQFSYDRLKNEKEKHCFLYCALYPEDFKISKDELISYWIAEGYMDEIDSEEATYDKAHTIINKLENNCLLEGADDGRCVKMHDLIRDMALHITSKSPLFMIKAGVELKEFPRKEEWKTSLEKSSLMKNDLSEIPSNMSPNCPALSTLLLQKNLSLEKIPESFFVNMQGLKILDLSHTNIEVLPNSISDSWNLTALLLGFCQNLRRIPSLANLSALQNFNMEGTCLWYVPEGMEKLKNLRYLNLYSWYFGGLTVGMLSKLYRLRKLRVRCGFNTSKEVLEEAASLNKLDTFEAGFGEVVAFNSYVKSINGPMPKNYRFAVSDPSYFDGRFQVNGFKLEDVNKFVTLKSDICERLEESILLPEDIQYLRMDYCQDVSSLSDLSFFNKMLSKERKLNGKFSDLKALFLLSCRGLKKLFSHNMIWALHNLEVIDVDCCYYLEEIFALDDVDDEEKIKEEERSNSIIYTFTLPKLRKLRLCSMPSLKSICCSNGVLVCDSLQEIELEYLPFLKRLPLSLPLLDKGQPSPHPAIKQIKVSRYLWESLGWDNPNAKNVLEPYCHFS